jgi:hypothetical protein
VRAGFLVTLIRALATAEIQPVLANNSSHGRSKKPKLIFMPNLPEKATKCLKNTTRGRIL